MDELKWKKEETDDVAKKLAEAKLEITKLGKDKVQHAELTWLLNEINRGNKRPNNKTNK